VTDSTGAERQRRYIQRLKDEAAAKVGQLGLDGEVIDIAHRLVRLFEGDRDRCKAVLFSALSHLAANGTFERSDGTPTQMFVCDFKSGKGIVLDERQEERVRVWIAAEAAAKRNKDAMAER
jgi:hypothetical protein